MIGIKMPVSDDLLLDKDEVKSIFQRMYDKGYHDGVEAYKAMMELEKEEKEEDAEDCISREVVGYYIQSFIHEIITESGTDKNEHTNSILRSILNGIKTMSSAPPVNKVENQNHYEAVIKNLRKRLRYKKGKWIPTSEQLPMIGDTYLVTIEYNGEAIGVDAASYSPVEGYIDKRWNTFNDWKEDDDSCYHVTAWMPLPEPYKAESEDKE